MEKSCITCNLAHQSGLFSPHLCYSPEALTPDLDNEERLGTLITHLARQRERRRKAFTSSPELQPRPSHE